ncbi:RNA polymerase I-specific transcription initiation factor RRN3-domain-containing protein [Cladochytrium replicatum]|nr:RNA polymerase I-specific transcription initiation factor RRN3-domain-containing protein [Cladochytrium replicatum]
MVSLVNSPDRLSTAAAKQPSLLRHDLPPLSTPSPHTPAPSRTVTFRSPLTETFIVPPLTKLSSTPKSDLKPVSILSHSVPSPFTSEKDESERLVDTVLFQNPPPTDADLVRALSRIVKLKTDEGDPAAYLDLVHKLTTRTTQNRRKPSTQTVSFGSNGILVSPSPNLVSLLTLRRVVRALSHVVSQLKPHAADALVNAILNLRWICADAADSEEFVGVYRQFLENLVSAHAAHVLPVLRMLVRKLVPPSTGEEEESGVDVTTEEMVWVFEKAHEMMRGVLGLIPSGATFLAPMLADHFPHKSEAVFVQVWYLKNLLRVVEYAGVLRDKIWGLIVDRMIQVDVDIQGEIEELDEEVFYEIERLVLDYQDPTRALKEDNSRTNGSGTITDGMDSDSDTDDTLGSSGVTTTNVREMLEKMDAMMYIVLTYMRDYATRCATLTTALPPDFQQQQQQSAAPTTLGAAQLLDFFHLHLGLFDAVILTTHKSRYTQFTLFYLCSLSPHFTDVYLGLLVSRSFEPHQPTLTRRAALAYVASFCARARFVEARVVRDCAKVLCGWSVSFVEEREATMSVGEARRNGVFYGVVQSLLYIICFRWRELVLLEEQQQQKTTVTTPKWTPAGPEGGRRRAGVGNRLVEELQGLQRVLMSRFAPLRVCASVVVNEFARIMHGLQIAYVYPLIEGTMGPSGQGENGEAGGAGTNGVAEAGLDTFFPFDPMTMLKASNGTFVEPLYQVWEQLSSGEEDSESSSSDDECDDDDVDMNDEEDYEVGVFEFDESARERKRVERRQRSARKPVDRARRRNPRVHRVHEVGSDGGEEDEASRTVSPSSADSMRKGGAMRMVVAGGQRGLKVPEFRRSFGVGSWGSNDGEEVYDVLGAREMMDFGASPEDGMYFGRSPAGDSMVLGSY